MSSRISPRPSALFRLRSWIPTVRQLCEFLRCEFLGEHHMPNRRMVLYPLQRATLSSA